MPVTTCLCQSIFCCVQVACSFPSSYLHIPDGWCCGWNCSFLTCSVLHEEAKFSFVSSKYSSNFFSMAIDVVTSQVTFSHHLHTRVIHLTVLFPSVFTDTEPMRGVQGSFHISASRRNIRCPACVVCCI